MNAMDRVNNSPFSSWQIDLLYALDDSNEEEAEEAKRRTTRVVEDVHREQQPLASPIVFQEWFCSTVLQYLTILDWIRLKRVRNNYMMRKRNMKRNYYVIRNNIYLDPNLISGY